MLARGPQDFPIQYMSPALYSARLFCLSIALLLSAQTMAASYVATELFTVPYLPQHGRLASGQMAGAIGNPTHASVQIGPSQITDLHPAGYASSIALGTNGFQQVGEATPPPGPNVYAHAALWNGTADTFVDLQPAGALGSYANATNGVEQVGSVDGAAALWRGSADSYVRLYPNTTYGSDAYGTDGYQEVGAVHGLLPSLYDHAFVWSGSAASAVDLHPLTGDYFSSAAYGVAGGQQVGYASPSFQGLYPHALLWRGSAASVVDLNPKNVTWQGSVAYWTTGRSSLALLAKATVTRPSGPAPRSRSSISRSFFRLPGLPTRSPIRWTPTETSSAPPPTPAASATSLSGACRSRRRPPVPCCWLAPHFFDEGVLP